MMSDHCRDENHDLCGGALIAGDLHRRACTCSCHNLKGRAPNPAEDVMVENYKLAVQPIIKLKEAA